MHFGKVAADFYISAKGRICGVRWLGKAKDGRRQAVSGAIQGSLLGSWTPRLESNTISTYLLVQRHVAKESTHCSATLRSRRLACRPSGVMHLKSSTQNLFNGYFRRK